MTIFRNERIKHMIDGAWPTERLNVGVVVRRFLHTCTWSLEVWNQNGSNKEGSGTHCPDAMGSGTLGSLGQPLSARPRLCALRWACRFVVVLHLVAQVKRLKRDNMANVVIFAKFPSYQKHIERRMVCACLHTKASTGVT